MQAPAHFVKGKNFPAADRLSPQAKRLAEILLAKARAGTCVISQRELCKLTGWSRPTVSLYLTELRARGIITWERRKRRPTVYRFVDHIVDVNRAGSDAYDGQLYPPLREAVARGHNLLLLGPEGIGKTFQLSLLAQDGLSERIVLRLPSGTVRDVLTYLWDTLAELEGLEDVDPQRRTVKELTTQVLSALGRSRHAFLVLADDVDRAPPALRRFFLGLLSLYNVQMVATAREEEKVADLVYHFTVLPLPPLSQEQTQQWVRNFIEARSIPVVGGEKGISKLARHIYLRSGGNPRKVLAMLRKIEAQGYVDRRLLREELHADARFQFVDMTWLIVATAACAVAIRYLSVGFHDRTLYVLAGMSYALAFVARWFAYRWRRPAGGKRK